MDEPVIKCMDLDKPTKTTTIQKIEEKTDETLYLEYEAGDRLALEELFRRYRRQLFYFVLRFLRDKNASQDAVQDVFLKIIKDPGRFHARSRFSTWLHAVARNLCIDMLRKKKYRNTISLDQEIPIGQSGLSKSRLDELPGLQQNPEQLAIRSSLRVKLLVAIHSIPDEQRVVFLLREISELPFLEIANILKIPMNTAKSRMRYALTNLRKALTQLGVEG